MQLAMNASNATIQINCNHSSKTKDLPARQSPQQLQLQFLLLLLLQLQLATCNGGKSSYCRCNCCTLFGQLDDEDRGENLVGPKQIQWFEF